MPIGHIIMRVVIHYNDEQNAKRSLAGIDTEYYEGGNNLHIVDDDVIQVAELASGRVVIEYRDHGKEYLDNCSIVTVYQE